MKLQHKITTAVTFLVLTGSAWAGSSSSSAAASVPELDGALTFLAVGLVAALIAVIKEKRRH